MNSTKTAPPPYETISIENISAVLKLRSKLYHLLKTFFLEEPSEKFLDNLINDVDLKILAEEYPEKAIQENIKNLLVEVENLSRNKESLIDVWAEYVRLFIGAPAPIVVPYESMNIGEKTLKGKVWLEVRDWMLNDGIMLENSIVLEDHVGVELEYMMIMSLNSLEAVNSKEFRKAVRLISRQRKFLKKHLLTWLPEVCKKLEMQSNQRLYKILAEFTASYLKYDLELLLELEQIMKKIKDDAF